MSFRRYFGSRQFVLGFDGYDMVMIFLSHPLPWIFLVSFFYTLRALGFGGLCPSQKAPAQVTKGWIPKGVGTTRSWAPAAFRRMGPLYRPPSRFRRWLRPEGIPVRGQVKFRTACSGSEDFFIGFPCSIHIWLFTHMTTSYANHTPSAITWRICKNAFSVPCSKLPCFLHDVFKIRP